MKRSWAAVGALVVACGGGRMAGSSRATGQDAAEQVMEPSLPRPQRDVPGPEQAGDTDEASEEARPAMVDAAEERPRLDGSPDAADTGGPRPASLNPLAGEARVELVKSGFGFAEGPVWLPTGVLLFSDIPGNTVHRLTPPATVEVFRKPSANANGHAVAPDGSVIACEHAARRVSRWRAGTAWETVADRWPGGPGTKAGRFNSPNDAIVARDGTIYFTDPDWGGNPDELGFTGVFRVDPRGGIHLIDQTLYRPNGIALSPDEKTLYVANMKPPQIVQYPILAGGTTGPARKLLDLPSFSDGMAVDDAGNLYTTIVRAQRNAIGVYGADGRHHGDIPVPKRPANCTFGDADRKTLYITAEDTLYRVRLAIPGRP